MSHETIRTPEGVIVRPPAATWRIGGDPLGLGKLRLAPGPGGVPDISLEEVVAMQSAYIAELRGTVEAQKVTLETIAMVAASLLWYAKEGHAPPLARDERFVIPQGLVEHVRGTVVNVGTTADGDMLLKATPGESLPRWSA